MRKSNLFIYIFVTVFVQLSCILFSAQAAESGKLTMQSSIPFASGAVVRSAIKNECNLPGKLPGFIQQYAKGNFSEIVAVDNLPKSGKGKFLYVEITDATGGGGGAWSGSKSVTIKGTLRDNGKIVGNFKARRFSGGGAFAGFKSTCAILGRCIKALGKDVARWMQNPSKDSALGDM